MASGWVTVATWTEADGTAISNSAAATSLLAGTDFVGSLIQPSTLKIGTLLRLTAAGQVSNMNPTPGNLTLDFRLGGTVVFNGGAMALNATAAKTNVTWNLEMVMRVTAAGSAATIKGMGMWTSEAVVGSPVPGTGGSGSLSLPASAPANGTSFDSRTALAPDLFATFQTANAANAISCLFCALEMMNVVQA